MPRSPLRARPGLECFCEEEDVCHELVAIPLVVFACRQPCATCTSTPPGSMSARAATTSRSRRGGTPRAATSRNSFSYLEGSIRPSPLAALCPARLSARRRSVGEAVVGPAPHLIQIRRDRLLVRRL